MTNKINIRKIKLDDAEEIAKIQYKITKKEPKTNFYHIIKEQLKKDEDISFVAEYNGKVVGYMISYVIYAGFGLDKGAWIATLGVDPKYMGQGIGKKLAQKVFEEYKKAGIKEIYTSVRWDSVDLLSFFKTLGFDRSEFINLQKQLS